MVSENTQPQAEQAQAQPEITDITPEGQDAFNPALPFVLPTEETQSEETSEQGAENVQAPPADPQQETEETSTQSVPSTETEQQSQDVTPAEPAVAPQINEPAPAIQPDFDTRMKDMEQQLKGYEAEKAQQAFAQQKQQVQAQYEQQGYDTEVATLLTQQWEANAMQMHQMQNAALHRENLMAGMMTEALSLSKEFNVDPQELLKYTDPAQMRAAAVSQSKYSKLEEENKKLKEQLAPAQKFDDNTASPTSEDSQEYWMDRYIQGDNSPKAIAAGRRAAGLQ
jgi:hypothetical protein